ncbi:RES family NAD+ phosphorylase [Arthrobacter sp. VKM Ac-2550]|uniref:RES family NAD+ phosphorylase n=1 Tax=Crystallibacter permensis TaxID=1938888 RepID=UPI0022418053|nr:RES family NAD+ phosphorylase [Arthrobacter sp. VKM Ac-2550]MCW2133406.1 RES domain-containing protein [Arthrobacter sp. VKM Ac-2550]
MTAKPGLVVTPEPPDPFVPHAVSLPAGTVLYRVHSNRFGSTDFNPGPKGPGRFHFFGFPTVPVLYAASTEIAAVAETLLRDIPLSGGNLLYPVYGDRVLSALYLLEDMNLAAFSGMGLRVLGVEARQLTDTPGENYPQTRKWAEAAHTAGFQGIEWMSRQDNRDRAYVFFGDRVDTAQFGIVPGSGRIFAAGDDLDWLVNQCGAVNIEVLPPH